jgi:ABC-type Fe3+ transport system substrate-binding protein
MFRRLFVESGSRTADVLLTLGPYHLQAGSGDDTFLSYQPKAWPAEADRVLAAHAPNWRWSSIGYLPFRVDGAPPITSFDALTPTAAPRLAILDPARSELGVLALLASLDRARQWDGDPERGWTWWVQRSAAGVVLTDDSESARATLASGRATHALTLGFAPASVSASAAMSGLAPMPITVAVLGRAVSQPAAQQLVDWLTSQPGAASVDAAGALSAWRAQQNGLAALAQSAPPLDVAWTLSQYRPARQRWMTLGITSAA